MGWLAVPPTLFYPFMSLIMALHLTQLCLVNAFWSFNTQLKWDTPGEWFAPLSMSSFLLIITINALNVFWFCFLNFEFRGRKHILGHLCIPVPRKGAEHSWYSINLCWIGIYLTHVLNRHREMGVFRCRFTSYPQSGQEVSCPLLLRKSAHLSSICWFSCLMSSKKHINDQDYCKLYLGAIVGAKEDVGNSIVLLRITAQSTLFLERMASRPRNA